MVFQDLTQWCLLVPSAYRSPVCVCPGKGAYGNIARNGVGGRGLPKARGVIAHPCGINALHSTSLDPSPTSGGALEREGGREGGRGES